jgi:hypothetical protein
MTHANFLVKVTDATMPQVRKALQAAGIEVRSIILVHKEKTETQEDSEEIQEEKKDEAKGEESGEN